MHHKGKIKLPSMAITSISDSSDDSSSVTALGHVSGNSSTFFACIVDKLFPPNYIQIHIRESINTLTGLLIY